MNNLFENCYSLTSLDLSNFDTSNVSNMSYMFSGCKNLENLDINHFKTSNVEDMQYCKAMINPPPESERGEFLERKIKFINIFF